jgi:hypothetical protein
MTYPFSQLEMQFEEDENGYAYIDVVCTFRFQSRLEAQPFFDKIYRDYQDAISFHT